MSSSSKEGWVVERGEVESLRIVAVRRRVCFAEDDLGSIIVELYDRLYGKLPADLSDLPGRNAIAYLPVGEGTADMFVGREWAGESPEDELEIVELPGGDSAHVRHRGPYEELPAVHQAIHSWLWQAGWREVGWNWEIYGDWSDDPAELVTDVYYTLDV